MLIQFIFIALVVFQLKHFLADYPLQNDYMLGKFRKDWGFLKPLSLHCLVHAFFTFTIVVVMDHEEADRMTVACVAAIFDFILHFFMDRIKASPRYLGRFKPLTASEYRMAKDNLKVGRPDQVYQTQARKDLLSNKLFWWCLGFDQMVHHLTDYAIILLMIFDKGLWING